MDGDLTKDRGEKMEEGAVALLIIWCVVAYVQMFLSYGTAYRLTKNGGDNGVALFGWMFVLSLASLIPGLGIGLYVKYKYLGVYQPYQHQYQQNAQNPNNQYSQYNQYNPYDHNNQR